MTLLFAFIFFTSAGICKAFMDKVSEKEKQTSWRNKWAKDAFKSCPPNQKLRWRKQRERYLWLFSPQYLERFPYSSTFLVWLTDSWHLYQFLFFRCLFTGFALLHIAFSEFSFSSLLWCLFTYNVVVAAIVNVWFEVVYSRLKKYE